MRRVASLAMAICLAACGNGTGGLCTSSASCQPGLVCVSTGMASTDAGAADMRACMRLCDHDAGNAIEQRLCSDGTACLRLEGLLVCYAGGNHSIDSACTIDTECEPGTVCAPDTMRCAQACTVGTDAPCGMGRMCVAIGGGICRPGPVDGGR